MDSEKNLSRISVPQRLEPREQRRVHALQIIGEPLAIGYNAVPAASAVVDIQSTAKGVLLPRMTTTQRDLIGSPATGLLIFNTTNTRLEFYNGATWAAV